MKAVLLDCNDQLTPVWAKAVRADDPAIDVNRAAFARDELPRLLDGYVIVLGDHSLMPNELVAQCKALEHIVFLGTGAATHMDIVELVPCGVSVHSIKGDGDSALAALAIALVFAAARPRPAPWSTSKRCLNARRWCR